MAKENSLAQRLKRRIRVWRQTPALFDALQRQMAEAQARLAEAQAQLQAQAQTQAGLAEAQAQARARLEQQEHREDVCERRLNDAEGRFRGQGDRLTGLEARTGDADRRLDQLEQGTRGTGDRLAGLEARAGGMDQRLDRLEQGTRTAGERLNGLEERAGGSDRRLDQLERREDVSEGRLNEAENLFRSHGDEIRAVKEAEAPFLNRVVDGLCARRDLLRTLNREMSVEATVWGDPGRIALGKGTAVNTCLFNTNSGRITIGDYTFAGSRVSLLAGGHDPALRGFLRRDAELTEGCDIVIGRGVWLASGCTLLGPCFVGDDAVIAAGAVVTPGTEVPPGSIYGGVPAREIGRLEAPEAVGTEDPAIRRALARFDGRLFTEGWSEKTVFPGIPGIGYRLEAAEGRVLCGAARWRLIYGRPGPEPCELVLKGSRGEVRLPLAEAAGEIPVSLPCACGEGNIEEIRVSSTAEPGTLFLNLLAQKEEGEQ